MTIRHQYSAFDRGFVNSNIVFEKEGYKVGAILVGSEGSHTHTAEKERHMDAIIRKKIHTLLIFDRALPEDTNYPLSGAKGLEVADIVFEQNIPFGRLVTDKELAQLLNQKEAKRYGMLTLLEDDVRFKPLFQNRKPTADMEEEVEAKVRELAHQLRAIRSQCSSLERLFLFGRAAQTLFDRALLHLEEVNPPAHEEIASMTCYRLPTIRRATEEQLQLLRYE